MVKRKTTEEKVKSETKKSEIKTTPKSEQSNEPKQTKQTGACGKCCILSAVVTLIICCVVSYFMCEKICRNCNGDVEQKMHACRQTTNTELMSLKNTVAELKKDIDECKTIRQVQHDNAKLRTKWKVWLALKNKMESGEAIDAELKQFKEVFAEDSELLKKVDDLLNDSEKKANVIPADIRKYVDKFIKLKRVDLKKVAEISGYVLSSPCNGE